MGTLYTLSVTLHVLAAIFWLGGMFFLGVIGAPVLRSVDPPSLRVELFRKIGERARLWGWSSIGILVATGVLNLHLRGLLSVEQWVNPNFWTSRMGRALAWKLAIVAAMVAASAVHDFILGPRAGRRELSRSTRETMRRRAALLARANAGLGILLVYWAVRLSRGG